jgi:hypothetical protein
LRPQEVSDASSNDSLAAIARISVATQQVTHFFWCIPLVKEGKDFAFHALWVQIILLGCLYNLLVADGSHITILPDKARRNEDDGGDNGRDIIVDDFRDKGRDSNGDNNRPLDCHLTHLNEHLTVFKTRPHKASFHSIRRH